MNLWWRSSLLKRDTFFNVPDAKTFPNFKPSYENEKHDMWAVMRMDYQKRWEAERDEVRDDYEFYRKEKMKYLQRRYVTRMKKAEMRKEQLLGRKLAEMSIRSKFSGVPARVDSNLKRSQSEASRPTRGSGDGSKKVELKKSSETAKNKVAAKKTPLGDKEASKVPSLKTLPKCCEANKEKLEEEKPIEEPDKNNKENECLCKKCE
ncbi:uncharacterized protein LOC106670572 [Cimex lectularius]|uniref:Uncharacterized protein n=1 Tax=Cimex lectularius TaxID=79782 RepID=A0A8I6TGP9_CIMLE|nr:uncharacterized protein LOC106670572 [Cimex lectularius]